ncbi:MAG: hypothetical protein E1N59_439 [Puniceicoccaceae bacterium 5H]|nr:MAG: hypothetical protein E1N59_439 [Puniceicoccaceae bacterium 5H]
MMKSAKEQARDAWEAAWRMRVERTAGENERLRRLVKARMGGSVKASSPNFRRSSPLS